MGSSGAAGARISGAASPRPLSPALPAAARPSWCRRLSTRGRQYTGAYARGGVAAGAATDATPAPLRRCSRRAAWTDARQAKPAGQIRTRGAGRGKGRTPRLPPTTVWVVPCRPTAAAANGTRPVGTARPSAVGHCAGTHVCWTAGAGRRTGGRGRRPGRTGPPSTALPPSPPPPSSQDSGPIMPSWPVSFLSEMTWPNGARASHVVGGGLT